MIQECVFNPQSDIEEVVPGLSVDVAEVMSTHVVPSSGNVEPYTNPDSIAEVGSYIRDKIDGTIALLNINKSIARAKAATPPSSSSGPGSSTPSTSQSTPSAQQSAE